MWIHRVSWGAEQWDQAGPGLLSILEVGKRGTDTLWAGSGLGRRDNPLEGMTETHKLSRLDYKQAGVKSHTGISHLHRLQEGFSDASPFLGQKPWA